MFLFSRCSDCMQERMTTEHSGQLVPKGASGRFCDTCFNARADDFRKGREVRAIGLPPYEPGFEWSRLEDIVICHKDGGEIVVEVIYRQPNISNPERFLGGEIRARVKGQPIWEGGLFLDPIDEPHYDTELARWMIVNLLNDRFKQTARFS